MFSYDDIELSFEDDALDLIVNKAIEFSLGARGLRSICETIMIDAMYELNNDEKTLNITKEYAEAKFNENKKVISNS